MKRLFPIVAFTVLALSQLSCSKDDPDPVNPNITFTAVLNGASESTPNPSAATGSSTLTFNNTTKIFTISTTYTGMTATMGHIHKGAVGVAGPVVFGFTNLVSPINYTSVALDATQEADLKANMYYVNIHSAAYSGGEIRGQLIRQ